MRIGIDARMFQSSFTGIGRYTFELVRHLAKLDKKNEYVIFLNSPEYERFQPPPRFSKRLANARHYSWAEQVRFLRLLQKEKLDLMHFTHFNAPLFYRRPSVVTIHDLTLSFFPGKKMTRWFHRLGYHLVLRSITRRCQKIIAVSQNTKKDLQKVCKINPRKVRVIYEGAGEEFARSLPEAVLEKVRRKFDLGRDFVLYTGVWRDHKNVAGLVEAFARAREQGVAGLLVITGRENPAYPEVRQKIAEFGLRDVVRLTGLVSEEELRAFYHLARVYAFPSFYEGFGLPVLEAMSAGLPVAASRSSSIPEVCGEGNAVFFNPYDTADMAQKLARVWSDEELRRRLIQRGKQRARDFTWRKMAEETLTLYNADTNNN